MNANETHGVTMAKLGGILPVDFSAAFSDGTLASVRSGVPISSWAKGRVCKGRGWTL